MGSCVSVHNDQESAMKLRLSFGSKKDKLVITGGDPTVADVALKSNPIYNVRDFGSKEEALLDSQPWLESDCEDDFSSVNSDFISSQGSTPVHHSSSVENPVSVPVSSSADFISSQGSTPVQQSSSVENPVSVPVSSSGDKKKKLSDLLKESLQVDHDSDEQNAAGNQNVDDAEVKAVVSRIVLPPNSAVVSPDVSGANFAYSSQGTLNGLFRPDDKSVKSCLPSLISSRSFSERKKRMSHSRSAGRRMNWVQSFCATYMVKA